MKDFTNVKDNNNIIWCHWDLARFLTEENCKLFEGIIIALCDYRRAKDGREVIQDLRIYLYQEDDRYKVQVYTDDDNSIVYEHDTFDEARNEFDMIYINHPEHKVRPSRYYIKDTMEELK